MTPDSSITLDSASVPFRVGQGFDIHRTSDDPDRTLVLGGVEFPGSPGLVGHSDADVVAHACVDALLGAAGLGDIGEMFPDTDPRLAGADSLVLLGRAAEAVRSAGWIPANIDCVVVLDRPKLTPVKEQMQANLSKMVGAPVTVKGRRSEGIGSLGRGEAVVAWAVAMVVR